MANNPSPSNVNNFEALPKPLDLLERGGLPGVEYLYLLTEQQADAQEAGWTPIVGMRAFKVKGLSATLMAKGRPIPGAAAGGSRCKFHISTALRQALHPEAALAPERSESKAEKPPKGSGGGYTSSLDKPALTK